MKEHSKTKVIIERTSVWSRPFMVVFLIFLVLKLTDLIDWSWWWVTAPLWAPWALAIAIVAGLLLMAGTWNLFDLFASALKRWVRGKK